ncbi:hypothetical protein NK718_15965 [Alsobacter sp. SYSU M60028]|uniref:Uncharacterized protein n=1 Tax=Alsobacter ponti TaxID=2962936 RepID=A0ABT1LIH9_9HYPH|nr:hypothetical protein [Alsobacter ponti]MCP8940023.1 hypothetical protein [Alsobacter ponti]
MAMHNLELITSALFLSVVAHPAFAESPLTVVERTVVSGSEFRIGEYYQLNADCSPVGDITVKLLQSPKNGTAEVSDAALVTNFPPANQRHQCNTRKSPGVVLKYQAKDGFVGKDKIEALIIYPTGLTQKYRYVIEVK